MSDLEAFRDHARRLSASDHRDDCKLIHRVGPHGIAGRAVGKSCPRTDGHDIHDWDDDRGLDWVCPGLCGGCMPDEERALWWQLADEVDAYLSHDDGPDLFGGAS